MSCAALVVPAFNEERAIRSVVAQLVSLAPVIVVDDASTDRTADEAAAAGATVVRLDENRGYGGAIDAGFCRALEDGFGYVVTVDGDGQHEPREVEHFVRLVEEGEAELVVGIRPHTIRALEKLCALYARAALGVRDPLCGLKAYDLRFFQEYGGFDLRRSVGTELMAYAIRHGARWQQCPITIHERNGGGSRFYASVRGNLRILRSLWALVLVR